MWSSSLQVDVLERLQGNGTSGLSPKMWCLLTKNASSSEYRRESVRDLLRFVFKLKNTFPKLTFDWMQFIQMSVPSDFG